MKLLFICNINKHRSKTAEELFKDRFETKSAGIYRNHVTKEHLDWADLVLVMEDHQRTWIAEHFPKEYLEKKIMCLDIPDIYSYNQKELRDLIERKISVLLEPEI